MKTILTEPTQQTTCRVVYGDTDAGGVVYYANYLRYFEIGRTEYMRELVCSYRELENKGFILPVIESYCRYKASATYDDMLIIKTSLFEVKSVSCRFNYHIMRDNGAASPTLLAKGFTVNAAVNRAGKLTRLPDEVFDRLRELTGQK